MGKISPLFDDRHRGKRGVLQRIAPCKRVDYNAGSHAVYGRLCRSLRIRPGYFLTLPPPRSLRAHAALYCPHGKSGRCRPRDGRTPPALISARRPPMPPIIPPFLFLPAGKPYKRVDLNLQYPAGWEEAKEIKNLNRDLLPLRRAITSAQPLSKRRKAVPYTISQERTIFPSHSLIIPRER